MTGYLRTLASVAGLLFALNCTAHATDLTLVGDAHVTSAHPATNYGALSNLAVSNSYTTLLQFDLASLPAGTVGTVSNTATTGAGTLTISNSTTTPTLNINFPSGSSAGGSGTSPVGLSYALSTHEFTNYSTPFIYFNPATGGGNGSSSSAIGAFSTALVPAACTPSYTIYNASAYYPLTFQLETVVPSATAAANTSGTWTEGSAIGGTCTISSAGATGTVPLSGASSCAVNTGTVVAAGTPITLKATNLGNTPTTNTYYVLYVGFSCQ